MPSSLSRASWPMASRPPPTECTRWCPRYSRLRWTPTRSRPTRSTGYASEAKRAWAGECSASPRCQSSGVGSFISRCPERVGLALRLALLTGTRANEVAGIALPELHDLTGSRPHWIVPGERTKNKRDHLVPLLPALKVVKQATALLSEEDAFLFISSRKRNGRIGAHALTVAMRRFCETTKAMPARHSGGSPVAT